MKRALLALVFLASGCEAILDTNKLHRGEPAGGDGGTQPDGGTHGDGGTQGDGGTPGACAAPHQGPFFDYANPLRQTVANAPEGITLGDVNGDGVSDIVVLEFNSSQVFAYSSNGAKQLTPIGSWSTSCTSVTEQVQIAVADVTGDANPDIVVSCPSVDGSMQANVNVLVGQGAGKFATGVKLLSSPTLPFGMVVADVDGDGANDVVATNNTSTPTLVVYWGTKGGDITKVMPQTLTIPSIANLQIDQIVAAPLGGGTDKTLDIVANFVDENTNDSSLAIFRQSRTAKRTFSAPEVTPISVNIGTFGIGTIDDSGLPALILTSGGGDLYWGDGTSGAMGITFADPKSSITTAFDGDATHLGLGDLNCDGLTDVVLTNNATPLNAPDGDFYAVYEANAGTYGSAPGASGGGSFTNGIDDTNYVALGDISGDGIPDIVITMERTTDTGVNSLRVVYGLAASP